MNKKQVILNNVVKKHKETTHYILPSLPFSDSTNTSYFIVHHWMASILNLTGTELMLYAVIFNFCNTTGKVCYCSRKALASYINATDVTITNTIKKLEEKNLIIVDRHLTDNNVNENYYLINTEVLFKALSTYDINIDFSNLSNTSDNQFDLQLDKLYSMAEEYNKIDKSNSDSESNTNRNNISNSNSNNQTKSNIVKDFDRVVNNFNYPLKNFNTNNIINNIDNNIETNKNNIFISTAEADFTNSANNINITATEREIKQNDKKQVFNLSSNKNKTKIKPKNNKSEKAANNVKLFNLIKQMFANEEINEPKLVEILTKYLQGRIGMRDAKALTYEVWKKQLELLLDICEGDYEYAYEIVMQAYLGQYRVMCFPNQKKSNKSYYGNNRKMSYNINVSEEQNNLSKKSIKERKELLQDKLARDENGNSIKF